MLKRLSAAAVSLGFLLSATPGQCYSITPLGVFTGMTNAESQSFKQEKEASPIEDYYTFSVTQDFKIAASATNSFSEAQYYINGFTFELFAGAPPAMGSPATSSPIAGGGSSVANNPPDSQTIKFKSYFEAAGDYYLRVTGSASGLPSYAGSVSISAVPLPASAPMFGGALLALAAMGYRVKRRKAVRLG